jgi:hypothetical protein
MRMHAATSTSPRTVPSARALAPGGATVGDIAPALVEDIGHIFRQLGLESCRASVVDMGSLAFQGVWAVSDSGEAADPNPDLPLDSQFPGAVSSILQLAQASTQETVVQRLSPRHWSLAWRIDDGHVVVAEVRYAGPRAVLGQIDTALVRVVCDAGIRAGLLCADDDDGGDNTAPPRGSMVWPPGGDRRRRRRPPTAMRWSLGLAFGGAALALWLAVAALPELEGESANGRSIADRTLTHHVSVAMATGDYGEVQHVLSTFESLGYFQAAAVTNARQKLVSLAGNLPGLRIGEEVPARSLAAGLPLELAMGSETYGQLVVVPVGSASAFGDSLLKARLAAAATFAAALLAGTLLLLRRRRARRNGD